MNAGNVPLSLSLSVSLTRRSLIPIYCQPKAPAPPPIQPSSATITCTDRRNSSLPLDSRRVDAKYNNDFNTPKPRLLFFFTRTTLADHWLASTNGHQLQMCIHDFPTTEQSSVSDLD